MAWRVMVGRGLAAQRALDADPTDGQVEVGNGGGALSDVPRLCDISPAPPLSDGSWRRHVLMPFLCRGRGGRSERVHFRLLGDLIGIWLGFARENCGLRRVIGLALTSSVALVGAFGGAVAWARPGLAERALPDVSIAAPPCGAVEFPAGVASRQPAATRWLCIACG